MRNFKQCLIIITIPLIVNLAFTTLNGQDFLATSGLSIDTGFNFKNPVDFPTGDNSDFWYDENNQKPITGFGFKFGVRKKIRKQLYIGIKSSYRRFGLEENGTYWGGITGGGFEYESKRIIHSISLAPSISFQLNKKTDNLLFFNTFVSADKSLRKYNYQFLYTAFSKLPAISIENSIEYSHKISTNLFLYLELNSRIGISSIVLNSEYRTVDLGISTGLSYSINRKPKRTTPNKL